VKENMGEGVYMLEDHFRVLPQHKARIISLAKILYRIDVSEAEVDELQKEEPFVNFNNRQAEFLRRMIVLRKICYPILKSHEPKTNKETQDRFQFSFMNRNLNEAQVCFVHGLYLASIILCRSSLETGLRESIAHIECSRNKTSFVKEYAKLEKIMFAGLILKAQNIHLMEEEEINDILSLDQQIEYDFKPRNILDKFIRGGYSDLFVLLRKIEIEGKGKGRDFEDFIKKMHEQDKVMEMGESFTRNMYVTMLLREELALFFIHALFRVAGLIFFERLPEAL
jgi:hypothetical protein